MYSSTASLVGHGLLPELQTPSASEVRGFEREAVGVHSSRIPPRTHAGCGLWGRASTVLPQCPIQPVLTIDFFKRC